MACVDCGITDGSLPSLALVLGVNRRKHVFLTSRHEEVDVADRVKHEF